MADREGIANVCDRLGEAVARARDEWRQAGVDPAQATVRISAEDLNRVLAECAWRVPPAEAVAPVDAPVLTRLITDVAQLREQVAWLQRWRVEHDRRAGVITP